MAEIAHEIASKVEKLISMYEAYKEENRAIRERLALAQEQLDAKKIKIKELENKIEILTDKVEHLQLVDAVMLSGKEVGQSKKRVSDLIEEIDNCIAMLND